MQINSKYKIFNKMAFNYSNLGQQALENMLPFFNTLANGAAAAAMNPQNNFMNHLASTMIANTTTPSTTAGYNSTPITATSNFSGKANTPMARRTPEPPPAPILGSLSPSLRSVKPNQGTAPMDLENDENETPTPVDSNASKAMTDKAQLNLANGSMYLNSLLSGQIPGINPGFMFFPGANAAGQQAGSNSLLDSTTMMAVAMQQMQQYGGYGNTGLTDPSVSTGDVNKMGQAGTAENPSSVPAKEIIKTNSCVLFPPNPTAPPPTIRERPPGCRTVFVGGLPEQISEETLREIFESCGEISTLRMSKKNFCHIRFRNEESIDRAIFLSGYRLRLNSASIEQCVTTFARLHVDYAQARDDQYDYQCKQRQFQREQRHRERMSMDRLRSQSPPPIPHYTDHEASMVAESLRSNETFVKAVQTMTIWLERGDCTKRNANVFYSMIQSTHAHVRRLTADKQVLEEDLRKARESFRKQMLSMSAQFTQIEKVFNAASHKKVWDHFTKAQRKNIDQWKKLATELRSIQIEDDEMEMSDEDRDYQSTTHAKRKRYDSDNIKEENDSLRCQLEAMRNEMSLERTDLKYNSDFREKQMKVLQETIRNMQTQLLQTKMREQKDAKTIEQFEKRLKEAAVKQLLLKTKIREATEKLKDRELHSESIEEAKKRDNSEVIDIDVDKSDEDNKDTETTTRKVSEMKKNDERTMDSVLKQVAKLPPTNTQVKEEKLSSLPLEDSKIIALATAYLLIQPIGSSTHSLCSYIKNVTKNQELQENQINHTLFKYPELFKTAPSQSEKPKDIVNHHLVQWQFCGLSP